jgi:hypothetical protein
MLTISLSEKMAEYKKKSAARSGSTGKLFDAVVSHFFHNPKGDAIFADRYVAALAGMNNYLTQAAPCGSTKIAVAKCLT